MGYKEKDGEGVGVMGLLYPHSLILQVLQSHATNSGLISECHRALTEPDRGMYFKQYNSVLHQGTYRKKERENSRGNDAAVVIARGGLETRVVGPSQYQTYLSNLCICR